uniref:Uncharacterized protein n=1 Tax=Octactis speculum TaxID=3111310 RepID=A0A7S2DSJ5_9STRA
MAFHNNILTRPSFARHSTQCFSRLERDIEDRRKENDFLAIAAQMGMISEQEATVGRDEAAANLKDKVPSPPQQGRVGQWFGEFLVGTPLSQENVGDDGETLVDRFVSRMDEMNAASTTGEQGDAGNLREMSVDGQVEENQQQSQEPRRRKRKRKATEN